MKMQNKLLNIQNSLKVPKSQYNSFGKYSYRSCEDILEAVKPLLKKEGVTLIISDEIILIGDRYYVKATAKIFDENDSVEVTAYAREDESKKGQDLSQLTGSTSSYARKYALNGLLAIDDTKDSDTTNKHGKDENKMPEKVAEAYDKIKLENNEFISQPQQKRLFAIAKSNAELVKGVIKKYGHESTSTITKREYQGICDDIEHLIEVNGE